MRVISGLLAPRRGQVSFAGQDLAETPAHRRVNLGIVQVPEGRHLFPFMTVTENLVLGANAERVRASREARLTYVYSLFPVLQERRAQLAGTLSGGEQQMLAIGRGLASAPRLLMLDEPSMGLAPSVADTIFERIEQIQRPVFGEIGNVHGCFDRPSLDEDRQRGQHLPLCVAEQADAPLDRRAQRTLARGKIGWAGPQSLEAAVEPYE